MPAKRKARRKRNYAAEIANERCQKYHDENGFQNLELKALAVTACLDVGLVIGM